MKLNTLISEGAVLQQGRSIPLRGVSRPGLLLKAEIAGVSCFGRASGDGRFYPAEKAAVRGGSLLLSSSAVPAPLFVRYAWADNPCNILYNRLYPACSFSSEKQDETE